MKKVLSLLLTIPLALGLLIQPVQASEGLKIKYEIREGKAYVVGYKGEGWSAEIKDTYKGKAVVGIADEAFKDCSTLSEIEYWAEIEELGDSCFENCQYLEEVNFTDVKIIGDHAFQGCRNMESIDFWNVEEIGDYAFADCENLKEVDLPMDLKYIGQHAFENCKELEDLSITKVIEIDEFAFANCTSLESVRIPFDTKVVRQYAFKDCSKLRKVDFSKRKVKFEDDAFDGCYLLKRSSWYSSTGTYPKYERQDKKAVMRKDYKKSAKTEIDK